MSAMYPYFFKKKKKEDTPRVRILGVSYQYPCVCVGHGYLAKITVSVQHRASGVDKPIFADFITTAQQSLGHTYVMELWLND